MKYYAGVLLKTGEVKGKAVESKEEAEAYILEFAEQNLIKQGRIRELATGIEEKISFD